MVICQIFDAVLLYVIDKAIGSSSTKEGCCRPLIGSNIPSCWASWTSPEFGALLQRLMRQNSLTYAGKAGLASRLGSFGFVLGLDKGNLVPGLSKLHPYSVCNNPSGSQVCFTQPITDNIFFLAGECTRKHAGPGLLVPCKF